MAYQRMNRFEPARISFGNNQESLTIANRSFGIWRKKNCGRRRTSKKLPKNRRLFCRVSQKHSCPSGLGF